MRHIPVSLTILMLLLVLVYSTLHAREPGTASGVTPSFQILFDDSMYAMPQNGRLLVMLSDDAGAEPRFQINDKPGSQMVFGIDVNDLAPGAARIFDGKAFFGYPIESLADVPAGDYYLQALFHVYETFQRADGHVVQLPMDRGEGQQWNKAPGNLYSTPRKISVTSGEKLPLRITLDRKIPPIPDPPETKYIKHIKIKSERLTKFWGRPMYLGAHILLPHGYDQHPEARFPLIINHGHFPYDFSGFREEPPDPDLKPVYSERFKVDGYNRIQQEYAHQFYKEWIGPDFPRFLIIKIQHANPYYDDSYAVNSENLGPYGDAITYELVPYIEKKFRGIGQPWARFMYGGSTGGWEALAAQVFYPDDYNGCFAACPDPIDFRAYCSVNIYEDKNAYYLEGKWKRVPRPGKRDYLGNISSTQRDQNMFELALGSKARSGQQWDIWEAVYSPVGADGYPKPLWDRLSGEIDPAVAEYWRENYDLRHILERDWQTLGPKLKGKIHIYVGDMDNYYLNNAVYLMEDFLKNTKNPHYGGEIAYGDRAEHCWNGDHTRDNAYSRLRYHQMYVDKILKRIADSAPAGADTKSWRY